MEKNLEDDFNADYQNCDVEAVKNIYYGFFEKKSEQVKRATYKRVFGREYDCPSRKQPPLSLDMAFRVALQKIAQTN